MKKAIHERLISHVNRKNWWHVPPADPDAYAKRGIFLASSFADAEFWGRPLDEPRRVTVSNPLVGDEQTIARELRISPQHAGMTLDEIAAHDAKWRNAALEKGYDAIVLMSPKSFVRWKATGKVPRSLELNILDATANGQEHLTETKNRPQSERIFGRDCIAEMSSWPDACVDCCITDPPYNMSKKKGLGWAFSNHITMQQEWDIFSKDAYASFTHDWLKQVCRVVKPNGNILVFGSFHNIYLIGFVLQNLLDRRILQQVTWFKPNAQPNITGRLLTESTEFVIWAVNNTPEEAKGWTFNYEDAKQFNSGKQLRNMWTIPYTPASEKQLGTHPTQKPLALLSRMIKIWTKPEDVVLDCFLGTGTTAVACEALGRKWVGVEKDPQYARITMERLKGVQREIAGLSMAAGAD